MSKTKVAVLFGGQSSEHDVSCVSAATVINSIDRDYYDVVMVGITKDGRWLKTESVDKITDGSWRDGKVSMILSPDRTHKGFVAIENGKCKAEPVDVVFRYCTDSTVRMERFRAYLNLPESHMSDAELLHQLYRWISCLPK